MKSIACVLVYMLGLELRFIAVVLLYPIWVLFILFTVIFQDWKDSLPRGERSDPPRREREGERDGTPR